MPVLPHRPFSSHWSFLTRTWEEGDATFTGGCPLPPNIHTQSVVVSQHSSFYAWWLCLFITKVLPAEQMLYILNDPEIISSRWCFSSEQQNQMVCFFLQVDWHLFKNFLINRQNMQPHERTLMLTRQKSILSISLGINMQSRELAM